MTPKDGNGAQRLPSGLLPSPLGRLSPEEIDQLWDIFVAIARTWGRPDADPMPMRSQWLEFVELRVGQAPSYLVEYQNAIAVLAGWKTDQNEAALTNLLCDSSAQPGPASTLAHTTPAAHLKRYVVDEFIRVWLAAGGFREYGAGNYNGYISGSRFAVRPAYRQLRSEVARHPAGGDPGRRESPT
jgi:hypothetical protein